MSVTEVQGENGSLEGFCYDMEQGDKMTFLSEAPVQDKKNKKKIKLKDTYYEVKGETFSLRSKNYLADKVKQPSAACAFELVKIIVIDFKFNVWHAAQNLKPVRDFLSKFPNEFFIIFVRQVPGKPRVSVISITKRKPVETHSPADTLLETYLDEDDGFKNKRLKYIARLENAPWAILATVKGLGGEKPVIMGNGYLKQNHYRGDNYYEVDVDISSSFVARQIAGSVYRFSHHFKVSECFVIEGQSEGELPEKALAAWCFENIHIKKIAYKLTEEDMAFFTENPKPPVPPQNKSSDGKAKKI